MPEFDLLTLIQGGGGLANIGLLYLFWKLDRRLLAVELKLEGVKSNVG